MRSLSSGFLPLFKFLNHPSHLAGCFGLFAGYEQTVVFKVLRIPFRRRVAPLNLQREIPVLALLKNRGTTSFLGAANILG